MRLDYMKGVKSKLAYWLIGISHIYGVRFYNKDIVDFFC